MPLVSVMGNQKAAYNGLFSFFSPKWMKSGWSLPNFRLCIEILGTAEAIEEIINLLCELCNLTQEHEPLVRITLGFFMLLGLYT